MTTVLAGQVLVLEFSCLSSSRHANVMDITLNKQDLLSLRRLTRRI